MKQRCKAKNGEDDILKFGGRKKFGSKHGWSTKKDYLIKYSVDPSLEHVVETKWHIHIESLFSFINAYIIRVLFYS